MQESANVVPGFQPISVPRSARLTIEVEEDLHRRAKVVAARNGVSLAYIVRGLLTSYVAREEAK